MRKSLKITLRIGLILSCFGLIFIGFGLVSGGIDKLQNKEDHFLKKEVKFDNIRSLDLALSIRNIKIETSSDQHFRLTYYKKSGEKISYNVQHQELVLKQKEKFKIHFVMLSDFLNWSHQDEASTVTLAVPKNAQLKNISIDNNVGNVTIKNQHANKITVQQDTGNLTIYNSQLANGKITSNIGNIDIQNSSLSDINIDADTGNISAKNLTVLNLLRIDNNTGNTNVSLSAQSAPKTIVSAKTDVGNADISHQLLQGYSGKNRLSINGGTGNVHIK
ncbi:DUF4097 family beta strand repeat-containing protein [Streptococcus ratti]|uniref:DUF4097 domain-containing protein n=1 Tax=Streptococcus ratti TaxID=1341 RepID=A0A7X9LEC0_STRRT|nr:DUF4097 family beta strand repeat-containing protein [Streptococcus ratti]NMD48275.1 DUF4097 domain-containing protein [Streptococcus ratti]